VTFNEVRADWTRLGKEDPLWAVLVAPGMRGRRWDVDDFFATGREEVDTSLARLEPLGLSPGTARALDFGTGVGRLARALATRFDTVTAVDVSPTMLDEARRLDRSEGRIDWVLNEVPDLSFVEDASVDLVYSSLVLQHLPLDLARDYLREFIRVLRADGVAVVQVASRTTLSFKGLVFGYAPFPLVAWGQRHLLGYPAPMRMTGMPPKVMRGVLAGTGARVVETVEDRAYGGHWIYDRHYLVPA
jgi:SAM-dependent methyltransferase